MANLPLSPIQSHKDLRSADTDWKRSKTKSVRWSRGARPSAGVLTDCFGVPTTGSEEQRNHYRPVKPFSSSKGFKTYGNIVKDRGKNNEIPNRLVREKIYARREVDDLSSRSLAELAAATSPVDRLGLSEPSEDFLYSFDRRDSPGRPVTLDIFVKTKTAPVEREYLVITANGETLTGKKARQELRKEATDPGTSLGSPDKLDEDDGFELV